MLKDAFDFSKLNIDEGWELAPGAGPGIEMKMLSGSLDEINKIGVRTRLIRFLPGSFNTEVFVHDYWEEVYMITGSITLGNDEPGNRKITTLCYLNNVDEGGETGFDMIDDNPILIKPKKGRLIVFYNLNDDNSLNLKTKHAGLPVIKGEKWAFNLWLRDYNYINEEIKEDL